MNELRLGLGWWYLRVVRRAGLCGALLFVMGISLLMAGCGDDKQADSSSRQQKIVRQTITVPPGMSTDEPEVVTSTDIGPEATPGDIPTPESAATAAPKQTPMPVLRSLSAEDFYTANQGDSLAAIAAKQTVYGDPLKWPLLLRFNRKALSYLEITPKLPDQALKIGTRLKIPELNHNSREISKPWVVNVLSSPVSNLIVVDAARLIRNGYAAYIVKFNFKGQSWMRLRVGFFQTKAQAVETGNKIKSLLKLDDSWVTKMGPSETVLYIF